MSLKGDNSRLAHDVASVRKYGTKAGLTEKEIQQNIKTIVEKTKNGENCESFVKKIERLKDPAAWECLSDDQRDIIDAWYKSICDNNREEKEYIRSESWASSYTALLPFAAIWAYQDVGKQFDLSFFLSTAIAWGICAFVFTIFRNAYEYMIPKDHSKFDVFWHIICVLFFSLLLIGAIFK